MKRIVVLALAGLLLGSPFAAAQQPEEGQGAPPPTEVQDGPTKQAAPAAIQVAPDAIRAPEERRMPPSGQAFVQQCEDLLRTDAAWRTRLRDQLTQRLLAGDAEAATELSKENLEWRARMKQELASEIHQEDADLMARNRKHVIMAYAALWVLTALFIVYMYMRQVRLREEITRLEREIRDAAKS